MMNHKGLLSPLTFYLVSYCLIALGIWTVFNLLKQHFGQKLMEGDVFGGFEFYGGMVSGMVRWACMYLFFLSLLHAPFYSEAERAEHIKQVEYNYGSDFFPTICKIQDSVFVSSLTGRGADKYLNRFLMQPVSSEAGTLRNDNSMARRNELLVKR